MANHSISINSGGGNQAFTGNIIGSTGGTITNGPLGPAPENQEKNQVLAALRELKGELTKTNALPPNDVTDLTKDIEVVIERVSDAEAIEEGAIEKLTTMQTILDRLNGNLSSIIRVAKGIGELFSISGNLLS